jgi:hypothetical protein
VSTKASQNLFVFQGKDAMIKIVSSKSLAKLQTSWFEEFFVKIFPWVNCSKKNSNIILTIIIIMDESE